MRTSVPSPVATSGNGGGSGRGPSPAAAAQPRFFFAGDGHLTLSHAHFAEKLDVRYRRADGTYDPAALARIRHFFRSREDGREAPISLRLIELLAYIQDHFHPRQMTLLSGYRSPEFNADLRAAGQKAAQASLHTEGLAADIAFAGVDLKRLWGQLRQLRRAAPAITAAASSCTSTPAGRASGRRRPRGSTRIWRPATRGCSCEPTSIATRA